ncbi:hypothetical protein Q1695_011347 [Nippostrongylus brasiliensis]|nr:hypothetical protein Q1695_011347 [Nippostrongylus brasiliensis]
MQCCRYGLGVTALNGTIFAVGGWNGGQTLREAEMLDPRQGKWISLPSMMNGRYHFGLAAVNGLLYAAGGDSGGQILDSILTDNGWTFLPEMSIPRKGLGVVNVDEDHAKSMYDFELHLGIRLPPITRASIH